MTPHDIERWVDEEYTRRFCGNNNQSEVSPNLGRFQKELEKIHPGHDATIYKAITKYADILNPPRNTCPTASMLSRDQSLLIVAPESTCATAKLDNSFEAWVYIQYLEHGFKPNGDFRGYKWLGAHLRSLRSVSEHSHINQTISALRKPGHKYTFYICRDEKYLRKRVTNKIYQDARTQPATQPIQTHHGMQSSAVNSVDASRTTTNTWSPSSSSHVVNSRESDTRITEVKLPDDRDSCRNDLLARKLNQLEASSNTSHTPGDYSDTEMTQIDFTESGNSFDGRENCAIDALLSDESDDDEKGKVADEIKDEICHAPLLSAGVISEANHSVVPQYGLFGSYDKDKLFLNTNVPFLAFICGVQGSGKSHTTACILENALIPSPQLGRLKKPLSALVFSYGQFGGDGISFSVSEAAFLAAPHFKFPNHPHVNKVHVLVAPSNYARISRLYSRLPNVLVSQFKLKPSKLDIDTMLTLMNAAESDDTPLYMAAVTRILRDMATGGGAFNYFGFKGRLKQCKFNPAQENMLQMRLELLESFLDLDDSCPSPEYKEGEVTIMDMSCPFVDANTACILFRIGLQRYLQSGAAGKLIVFDEAHKYMLPNPGARALNETILATIRLQRHYGARIVISTQEPTLLTNLIPLCSITVIHRFSSPEWFTAIKRHIPIRPEEHHSVMETIECLKTGTALVYSPNAVLDRGEDGGFVKGTGKLMKVKVRKRVTSDGGLSVLAV